MGICDAAPQVNTGLSERILILSGIQLSTNPRVVKEADALSAAGYSVEVLGAVLDPRKAAHDSEILKGRIWTYTPVIDAASSRFGDRVAWQQARLRSATWRKAARFGAKNVAQTGYAAPEMLSYALAHPARLTILHNPQSLWVGTKLMAKNRAVAADIEDWYSEDLLPEDRKSMPVASLREWEKSVLRGAAYSTTTSRSLSAALADSYGCAPPAVVYNAFSRDDSASLSSTKHVRAGKGLSLCWFSQVIGPGRGLETLIDALPHVRAPIELSLRGSWSPAYRHSILSRAPEEWRDRITFHTQVPSGELMSRIAEHDIGYAGEVPFCRSRDLTITNKILQYLLAGLAVVASDTSGQREVAEVAGKGVSLFPSGDHAKLAENLNALAESPELLSHARRAALAAASSQFSWEASKPVLLDCVASALEKSSHANAPVLMTRGAK